MFVASMGEAIRGSVGSVKRPCPSFPAICKRFSTSVKDEPSSPTTKVIPLAVL
jgi:hypothetical protein